MSTVPERNARAPVDFISGRPVMFERDQPMMSLDTHFFDDPTKLV
jgi:hypothetical protein